jgi:hypothetical protein
MKELFLNDELEMNGTEVSCGCIPAFAGAVMEVLIKDGDSNGTQVCGAAASPFRSNLVFFYR